MKSFKFKKIDAFTSGLSSGNPAGVIELSNINEINENEMQKIAFELKDFVSEVAFICPSKEKNIDFNFRYFSSEREVPFCGHATIATAYDLIKEHTKLQLKDSINIRTQKGISKIINKLKEENLVYIETPNPIFIETNIDKNIIAKALNIDIQDIALNPIEIVNVGQNILLVELFKKETCLNCNPDYITLKKFALENKLEVINIYTFDTVFQENNLRTRVFAPAFGYLEDPATGSANAALAYYLIKHKKWQTNKLIIEQNNSSFNPNIIILKNIENNVQVGGMAITKIKGEYNCYNYL